MPTDTLADIQAAFFDIGRAKNPLAALIAFQAHSPLLEDWRIIYATEDDNGPFKLRRKHFSKHGFVATLFLGKSLWVLDKETISTPDPLMFHMGTGTYVDSNSASFIRSLAYSEKPSNTCLNFCHEISKSFSIEELSGINPYLYLWEAQRHKSQKTVHGVRETIAALHGISLIRTPLNQQWANEFKTQYQEAAEAYADKFLISFYRDMDNNSAAFEAGVDIVEAVLTRAKLIEYSSTKLAQDKITQLIKFMHEELSTFMLRELIICADMFHHRNKSQISKKLNSLHNSKDFLSKLRNCAWDLFLLRSMDFLTNMHKNKEDGDFYLANLITFDRDLSDAIKLTELKAIALHRKSSAVFPIFNATTFPWFQEQVGESRLAQIENFFTIEGFFKRALSRKGKNVSSILHEDREKLTHLFKSKNLFKQNNLIAPLLNR